MFYKFLYSKHNHANMFNKASLTKRSYQEPVSTIGNMLEKDFPVYSYFPFASYINSSSPKGDLARHIKRKGTMKIG